MKRFLLLTLVLLLVVAIGYFAIPMIVNAESYVVIDINPSIEFVINRNGIVTNVNSLNEEGEIIIQGETFVDMTIEDATEKVIELALALGYLDPNATETDPNALMVTAYNGSIITKNRIRSRVENRLNNYFSENGIWGVVLSAEDIEDIMVEAESYNLSVGKYRLIKSIQNATSEYTFTVLASMTVEELMNLVQSKVSLADERTAIIDRITILEAIETPTEAESTELLIITARLSEIDALIAQAEVDKATLQEDIVAFKEARKQFKNAVKASFKNLFNGLSDAEQEQIKQVLYNRFNNIDAVA
ncbi:MAG: hypothetical protein WCX32_00230 [Clostridia bacterium]|jgi:hypothetical protein|nr:hypothetical protein [Clostridia bacterium]MDD4275674.1 hypothetical protein [Clostridia bacterium]